MDQNVEEEKYIFSTFETGFALEKAKKPFKNYLF